MHLQVERTRAGNDALIADLRLIDSWTGEQEAPQRRWDRAVSFFRFFDGIIACSSAA
jgi:hypothetical protein